MMGELTWLAVLDYASVFVFALSGGLAASRKQLDVIGFAFVSCLTAMGGGTVRDLLLDRNPVFWMDDPLNIAAALLGATMIYFAGPSIENRMHILLRFDAVALAVASAAGLGIALSVGHTGPIALIMAMITATFGGLLRDVVCNEIPLVLRHRELYVSAAFAGALAGLLLWVAIGDSLWVYGLTIIVTWALRMGSLTYGWQMPGPNHPPARQ